uniref:Uncharacterized protein n=1 Tax=Branchiostoma floridae TaxID=7739 RepID=C3YMC5_BRAFL|eukprot:XP_002602707.1 hypothetical protein BRAFLDRAFT_72931 [Branchiostoma floridae]
MALFCIGELRENTLYAFFSKEHATLSTPENMPPFLLQRTFHLPSPENTPPFLLQRTLHPSYSREHSTLPTPENTPPFLLQRTLHPSYSREHSFFLRRILYLFLPAWENAPSFLLW